VIILTIYFPFYESHPNETARTDPALVSSLFNGMLIWDSEKIHKLPQATPGALVDHEETYIAEDPRRGRPHLCGRRRNNGRQHCTCMDFAQTGKRCAGLWALVTLELCGRVAEFKRGRLAFKPAEYRLHTSDNSLLPQDDIEDLAEYWNEDILDNPLSSMLDLKLEAVTVFDPGRSLSPVSPIGRRYHESEYANEPDEPVQTPPKQLADTSPEAPNVQPVEPRGRLKAIRPLQPGRQPQKSTLALKYELRFPANAPTGSANGGTDCFALSLFHLLARQPEWNRAFDLFASQSLEKNRVVRLFQSFRDSNEQQDVRAFPKLQEMLRGELVSSDVTSLIDLFADAGLIQPHKSSQYDPVEFLDTLIDYLDSMVPEPVIRHVFGTAIGQAFRCPLGHLKTVPPSEDTLRFMLCHPDKPWSQNEAPNVVGLLEDFLRGLSSVTSLVLVARWAKEASTRMFARSEKFWRSMSYGHRPNRLPRTSQDSRISSTSVRSASKSRRPSTSPVYSAVPTLGR